MTAATNSFRGIRGIEEIAVKMAKLVDYLTRYRPDVKQLILSRPDYDLVARWPKAANVLGFDVTHNGIFYKGFQLTFNTEHGRYQPQPEAHQAVIE